MSNTIDKQLQRDVMKLLGWNEQQYATFIYDSGIAYLSYYIPDYPHVVSQITRSEIFWNWWKFHWEKRDKEFMDVCDTTPCEEGSGNDLADIYQGLHDARTLAAGIYLNGQVLEESYANMIGCLTKEQVNA